MMGSVSFTALTPATEKKGLSTKRETGTGISSRSDLFLNL
jgi:hypothetical protein